MEDIADMMASAAVEFYDEKATKDPLCAEVIKSKRDFQKLYRDIWFAMMICVNLETCFVMPLFGPAIFITRGDTLPEPGVSPIDIISGQVHAR